MSKKKKVLFIGIIMTEISHVFCCVLPLLFSAVGLLAGLGLVIILPDWLNGMHDVMHGYEMAVIIAAGVMVALGWAVHLYSFKNDCHDHGCSHQPCGPRKRTASKLLKLGTFLFVLNIVVFAFFHDGLERVIHSDHAPSVSYDQGTEDHEKLHDEEEHGVRSGNHSI